MKIRNKIFVINVFCLIMLFFVVACKENKQGLIGLFDSQKKLIHEKIQLANDKDYLSRVGGIFLDGNSLVINNDDEKTYMTIFNIKSKMFTNSFIKHGNGPKEMFSPPQSTQILAGNKLSYLDAQSQTLYQADYSQPDNVQIAQKLNLIKGANFTMGLIPMAYDYYIGIGFFEAGRYAVIDKKGKNVSYNFDYPKDDSQPGTNAQKAMAFQGGLIANPNRTKFFFYGMTSEILEIMQLEKNGSLTKIKDIHYDLAKYKPLGDGKNSVSSAIKKESKVAFISASATKKYIYLLYSGRTIESSFDLAFKSNTILVFDWEGRSVIKYNLDVDVNYIAVSEDDKVIYAIANTATDTNIIKFDL